MCVNKLARGEVAKFSGHDTEAEAKRGASRWLSAWVISVSSSVTTTTTPTRPLMVVLAIWLSAAAAGGVSLGGGGCCWAGAGGSAVPPSPAAASSTGCWRESGPAEARLRWDAADMTERRAGATASSTITLLRATVSSTGWARWTTRTQRPRRPFIHLSKTDWPTDSKRGKRGKIGGKKIRRNTAILTKIWTLGPQLCPPTTPFIANQEVYILPFNTKQVISEFGDVLPSQYLDLVLTQQKKQKRLSRNRNKIAQSYLEQAASHWRTFHERESRESVFTI